MERPRLQEYPAQALDWFELVLGEVPSERARDSSRMGGRESPACPTRHALVDTYTNRTTDALSWQGANTSHHQPGPENLCSRHESRYTYRRLHDPNRRRHGPLHPLYWRRHRDTRT